MTSKKNTRRALFMSVMSLLLCFAMLMGTTFAWFTDSVTSANNIIQAGNLDVELHHTDKNVKNDPVSGSTTLFDDVERWEPGALVYETLKVSNVGSLALKYNLVLNVLEESVVNGYRLGDVIMAGIIDGALGEGTTRQGLVGEVTEWIPLNAFSVKQNGVSLLKGESDEFTVVLYWQPNSNEIDNRYNMNNENQGEVLNLKVGVTLTATQFTHEEDSFGKDYDEGTKVPAGNVTTTYTTANNDGSASLTTMDAPSAATKRTTIDASAGAFEPGDQVEAEITTTNTLFDISAEGAVVANLDVVMKVNGTESDVELADGAYFTVTTYISKGLNDVTVAYTGTDGKAQPYDFDYDAVTGKLTFKTTHFSEYAVSGKALAYIAGADTALPNIDAVVDSFQNSSEQVIIPEVNQEAIEMVIESLPAEKQEEIASSLYAATVGEESYTSLAAAVKAAAETGATVEVLKDLTVEADNTITIGKDKSVVLDLNGKTVSGVSYQSNGNRNLFDANGGTLTVKNGTITITHAGSNMEWNASTNVFNVTGGGVLNIQDATIKNLGGSDMAFAVHLNNWGEVTLNATNTTFESTYVGIRAFNSGYDMNNISLNDCAVKSGNACLWVHNYTAADFGGNAEKAEAAAERLNLSFTDCTFERNGSNSLFRFGFTNAVYYNDPKFTVVVPGDADALIAALENGMDVLFNSDIKIEPANMSNAYGKTGINVKNGQTIDGGNHTLDIKGAGGTWDSGINTTGGLIKNIKVTGSFRGIFVNHNSTYSEKVILENVTIDGTVYTISCDQGMNKGLEATNSTFNGWTSYAATIGNVKFTNCSFGKGAGYAFCRPYAPTEFVGCNFAEGYQIDTRAATTFENCTIGGVALTAENLGTLVTSSNIGNASVK